MCLLSNRSQRTSKCGKNISDTLGCASCATFLFLPHFDVICDLLLNRRTATWILFVNQGSVISCILIRSGKYLVRSFLDPHLHRCETQAIKYWCLNAAQTKRPEICSIAWVASTRPCNSRTDKVYTNTEIVIITFLNARLQQYFVPKR